MFANTKKAQSINLAFPDVCKTPTPVGPIPIPYPNIGMNSNAKPPVDKIKYAGAASLNMNSKIKSSLGDQPGVAGGIISGKFGDEIMTILPVFTIILKSMPATRQLCLTAQNKFNMVGATLTPAQTKVKFNRF